MILTCPECATSYFVDDSRVPAAGRTVKCSHCGAKWTAVPEAAAPEAEPEPSPTPAPVASAPPADEVVVDGPEPAAASAPAPEPIRAPKVEAPPAPPRPDGKVIVLAVSAGVIVALVAGLMVFRNELAQAWPTGGRMLAAVGVPVNNVGLVIEGVKTEAAFQGGRPVLSVTGQVRNIRDEARTAPALRVSLLDLKGKAVSAKIAQPINGRVPAKAIRHFAIAIVDPPSNVSDLVVTFDAPGQGRSQGAKTAAPPMPSAPEPVDAKPLPPGSPDALPKHD